MDRLPRLHQMQPSISHRYGRLLAFVGLIAGGPLLCSNTRADDKGDVAYDIPEVLQLTGVLRDFRERTATGGHPDFEQRPEHGFGHYEGNVSATLGEDGKPFYNGAGFKVNSAWRDAAGRPITHHMFNVGAGGDQPGSMGATDKGGIASADTFDQWFNDVPGMNQSTLLTIELHQQDDGSYAFDDKHDPLYSGLGGFFPLDGKLFGNSGGSPDHNFHFTFELHTEFTYRHDAANPQVFTFVGDDDVWVFVDGRLVIDLGGVHAATTQTIDLNRLGLADGKTYPLDFFFAERHRTQSNFRIQTNIDLESVKIPSVTAAFD